MGYESTGRVFFDEQDLLGREGAIERLGFGGRPRLPGKVKGKREREKKKSEGKKRETKCSIKSLPLYTLPPFF